MSIISSESKLKSIAIGNKKIGFGHPCMIIAEAGVNHNGSEKMALELVDIAYEAGADAVKFQLFRTEEQISRLARTASYQYRNTGFETMLEMANLYDLSWDSHHVIASRCHELGIIYMASCFDIKAVDFFLSLGGVCIKVGSGEITNYPLLGHIAATGKPILLSTGMSTLSDVRGAFDHIRLQGDTEILLLQCVSNYPAQATSANLLVMETYAQEFGVHVGFSDHTIGNIVSIAAVALGACVIEKHFTSDKSLDGPDHAMSLDPDELRNFVADIRLAEDALGDGNKELQSIELETQKVARRSFFAAQFISAGEQISSHNVTLKRPDVGIDPRLWKEIEGRTVIKDVAADTPITWEVLL